MGHAVVGGFKKQRIEALSDGIFAIVMTLLVLELKVPAEVPHGQLWQAVKHDPEAWLSFAITFAIAARYWMLQHRVFDLTERFGQKALMLTFVFLGFVAILPYSTALVGRWGSDPVAITLYALNLTIIGAALIAKMEYIRIVDKLPKTDELQELRRRLWGVTVAMALAAGLAMIVPVKYIILSPIVVLAVMRRVFHEVSKRKRKT